MKTFLSKTFIGQMFSSREYFYPINIIKQIKFPGESDEISLFPLGMLYLTP